MNVKARLGAFLGAVVVLTSVIVFWWHSPSRMREGIVTARSIQSACVPPGPGGEAPVIEPKYIVTISAGDGATHTFTVSKQIHADAHVNVRVRWNRKGTVCVP